MPENGKENGAEGRKYGWAKTFSVKLPSGTWVRVRPVNISTLVRTGQIRKELAATSAQAARDLVQGRIMDYEKFGSFLEALFEKVLVEPTLAEVGFGNIPEGDISAIYQWVNGNYQGEAAGDPTDADLRPFPDGGGQPAPGPGGEAVRAPAQPAGGAA